MCDVGACKFCGHGAHGIHVECHDEFVRRERARVCVACGVVDAMRGGVHGRGRGRFRCIPCHDSAAPYVGYGVQAGSRRA